MPNYASPYYDPVKAHEYYMAHRELKGRRSTSNLNDEGKEVASYVKEQVMGEKKRLIEEAMAGTKSQQAANTQQTNARIAANREATNSEISSNQEALRTGLKEERRSVTEQISSHAERTQKEISSIREKLKKIGKKDTPEKQRLLQEIESLRADNAKQKEKLNESYAQFSDTARSRVSTRNTQLREGFQKTSSNLRSDLKSRNTTLSEELKTKVKELTEKYDNIYLNELDKIKADERYTKSEKSKKSSSSKSSGKKKTTSTSTNTSTESSTSSSKKSSVGFVTDYTPTAWKVKKS